MSVSPDVPSMFMWPELNDFENTHDSIIASDLDANSTVEPDPDPDSYIDLDHPRRGDPSWVARPRNPFIIFRCVYARTHSNPGKRIRRPPGAPPVEKTLSKRAAEAWHQLPPEEKHKYKILADREKEEHARLHPNYRFKPMKRGNATLRSISSSSISATTSDSAARHKRAETLPANVGVNPSIICSPITPPSGFNPASRRVSEPLLFTMAGFNTPPLDGGSMSIDAFHTSGPQDTFYESTPTTPGPSFTPTSISSLESLGFREINNPAFSRINNRRVSEPALAGFWDISESYPTYQGGDNFDAYQMTTGSGFYYPPGPSPPIPSSDYCFPTPLGGGVILPGAELDFSDFQFP